MVYLFNLLLVSSVAITTEDYQAVGPQLWSPKSLNREQSGYHKGILCPSHPFSGVSFLVQEVWTGLEPVLSSLWCHEGKSKQSLVLLLCEVPVLKALNSCLLSYLNVFQGYALESFIFYSKWLFIEDFFEHEIGVLKGRWSKFPWEETF